MSFLSEIRNDISGAEALADWLGGEPPVEQGHAEARASICSVGNDGEPCPMNIKPRVLERFIKSPAAKWIARQLEEKHAMRLTTFLDPKLHMCRACGCCLTLKVWTPSRVLKAHISQDQINQTPSFCWMRHL